MGKLVVSEFISVDGVVEDPGGSEGTAQGGWSFRHPAPGSEAYKLDELRAGDVMLLGRVTYDGFAAAWPAMEETSGEFGPRMNSMPKVVVSTTLTEATWRNSTIISGDVPGQVARLKEQHDGDILVYGSATLVDTLRGQGLIDEYRLMIHPVLLGEGKRLFRDGSVPADLELVGSLAVGPNVIVLTYRPAPQAATAG
ncbi:MAG: dihydrofolate reductase family protein [Streptosporangiaceae bacterium]